LSIRSGGVVDVSDGVAGDGLDVDGFELDAFALARATLALSIDGDAPRVLVGAAPPPLTPRVPAGVEEVGFDGDGLERDGFE
jgi:hypothetical protein